MHAVRLVPLVALAIACGNTDTPLADIPDNAPACTRATYDNCNSNADCDSDNCHLFSQDGIQVCTQACSAQAPCPDDGNGDPGICNNKGICKPLHNTVCKP